MLYVLIRTCPRDDYISKLAYISLKEVYADANYTFLAETGSYAHIHTVPASIMYRPTCDNFGGQSGVHNLLNAMKSIHLDVTDNDFVFLVDADIVFLKDVLPELIGIDHCGFGGWTGTLNHISGQFQILSGRFYKKVCELNETETNQLINDMLQRKISIADDTFISYVSDRLSVAKKNVDGFWIHHKFYKYKENTDFHSVLKTIKEEQP